MTDDVSPDAGPLPAELRAVLLAVLAKRVEQERKVATALASVALMAGTTRRVSSPHDGEALGSILRTDPKPAWEITDETALREHLATFPGCLREWVEIAPEDMPEALAVIAEHAPRLLTNRSEVSREAIAAAVEESRGRNEAVAPGITKRRPGGVVQVRPASDAAESVQRWVASGKFDWSDVLALDPPASEVAS